MKTRLSPVALAAICLASPSVLHAQDNPLAPYLEVPGARTTLLVDFAKSPFPFDFAQAARENFEQFHDQLGGDHALYYNLHLSEVMHTAHSKPDAVYRPLEKSIHPTLGDEVFFMTKDGDLT